MKWHSYLNTASQVLGSYRGEMPFHHFIRQFFKQDKKYGSRDRRVISQLCYGYLRLGGALNDAAMEERILAGYFLTVTHRDELLQTFRPEWFAWWEGHPAATLSERMAQVKEAYPGFDVQDIFPLKEKTGALSNATLFFKAHLVQPDVYLRIRPGHKKTVLLKLEKAGIAFRLIAPATIAVAATAPLDQVLELNREAVIQDASSQLVGALMEEMKTLLPEKGLKVWDCCAASGGKSILIKDVVGKMELTVSDVRESVLHNLRSRMKEAGIGGYRALVADLANSAAFIPLEKNSFDLIIADVPCSGSGTWSRTPEQLSFFKEEDIVKYTALQEKIVSRVLPYLKKGGTLLYITCSVFREENEDRVAFLQQEKGLKCVKATYLEGYAQKADTLYAAFFTA
ncbi:MAG: methyltransferase domain-containing protein [Chitinophagaceae bacterium]